jgi:hypothetical protein
MSKPVVKANTSWWVTANLEMRIAAPKNQKKGEDGITVLQPITEVHPGKTNKDRQAGKILIGGTYESADAQYGPGTKALVWEKTAPELRKLVPEGSRTYEPIIGVFFAASCLTCVRVFGMVNVGCCRIAEWCDENKRKGFNIKFSIVQLASGS